MAPTPTQLAQFYIQPTPIVQINAYLAGIAKATGNSNLQAWGTVSRDAQGKIVSSDIFENPAGASLEQLVASGNGDVSGVWTFNVPDFTPAQIETMRVATNHPYFDRIKVNSIGDSLYPLDAEVSRVNSAGVVLTDKVILDSGAQDFIGIVNIAMNAIKGTKYKGLTASPNDGKTILEIINDTDGLTENDVKKALTDKAEATFQNIHVITGVPPTGPGLSGTYQAITLTALGSENVEQALQRNENYLLSICSQYGISPVSLLTMPTSPANGSWPHTLLNRFGRDSLPYTPTPTGLMQTRFILLSYALRGQARPYVGPLLLVNPDSDPITKSRGIYKYVKGLFPTGRKNVFKKDTVHPNDTSLLGAARLAAHDSQYLGKFGYKTARGQIERHLEKVRKQAQKALGA